MSEETITCAYCEIVFTVKYEEGVEPENRGYCPSCGEYFNYDYENEQ